MYTVYRLIIPPSSEKAWIKFSWYSLNEFLYTELTEYLLFDFLQNICHLSKNILYRNKNMCWIIHIKSNKKHPAKLIIKLFIRSRVMTIPELFVPHQALTETFQKQSDLLLEVPNLRNKEETSVHKNKGCIFKCRPSIIKNTQYKENGSNYNPPQVQKLPEQYSTESSTLCKTRLQKHERFQPKAWTTSHVLYQQCCYI